MSQRAMNYGGYIKIYDTTSIFRLEDLSDDCFPYTFKTSISDSVALNKVKQSYNKFGYQYLEYPEGRPRIADFITKSINEIKILSQKENTSITVIGRISYEFHANCKHGTHIRDQYSNADHNCWTCITERSRSSYDDANNSQCQG
jgi:hypothetical protein